MDYISFFDNRKYIVVGSLVFMALSIISYNFSVFLSRLLIFGFIISFDRFSDACVDIESNHDSH